MAADVSNFIGLWLSSVWSLLTNVTIPGTNLTPGIVLIGGFVAVFGFRLLSRAIGLSFSSGYTQGGGNNKNIKVDDRRKDDKN